MRPKARNRLKALLPAAALLAAACWWILSWRRDPGPIGPLPAGVSVALRGHYEAAETPDGRLAPLYLGVDEQFFLCLQTPADIDTSQWQARLHLGQDASGNGDFQPPEVRMETTLCFRAPSLPDVPSAGREEFCGLLRDGYDGALYRLPCMGVILGEQGAAYWDLNEPIRQLSMAPLEEDLKDWTARLEGLISQADQHGFLLLAQQGRLIAANRLRVQGDRWALEKAAQLLAPQPDWLDSPAVREVAAETAFERAELELDIGRLESAWAGLARADEIYRGIAHPFRLTVFMRQAEILAQLGSAGEAVDRLQNVLDDCSQPQSGCQPELVPYAEGLLAWLSLLDPDSNRQALPQAGRLLRQALQNPHNLEDPLERANTLINLAYQHLLTDRDIRPPLQDASDILKEQPPNLALVKQLQNWSTLVEGLSSLNVGDAKAALRLCEGLAGQGDPPQLAAWAHSCMGRAQKRLGNLDLALRFFEEAVLIHENAAPQKMGRQLPLGSGRQADDYYRLARVLLDRGDPDAAWETLLRLDRRSGSERERIRCREQALQLETEAQWQRIDQQRRDLLAELIALEAPASDVRRAQLEEVRQSLMSQLRELSRQWPGCPGLQHSCECRPADFRAVALDDEILLLHRRPDGKVMLDHRTPISNQQGRRWLRQALVSLRQGSDDGAQWRRLAAPFAQALLPQMPQALGEVSLYGLHGWLQEVPLAALPVEAAGEDGQAGWLSDLTIPAVRPFGLHAESLPQTAAQAPLFFVDPLGDLPGGRALLNLYRRKFPNAHILLGSQADSSSLNKHLPFASFLHVDAHVDYNAAFAELSRLQASDGALTLLEMAEFPSPRRFVNLSGCQTGRWPVTADSGHYGLAGVFARGGTSWVVASRFELDDRLAQDFNRVFYSALAEGLSVPQSYRRALAQARRLHPPSAWSALMLLRGSGS